MNNTKSLNRNIIKKNIDRFELFDNVFENEIKCCLGYDSAVEVDDDYDDNIMSVYDDVQLFRDTSFSVFAEFVNMFFTYKNVKNLQDSNKLLVVLKGSFAQKYQLTRFGKYDDSHYKSFSDIDLEINLLVKITDSYTEMTYEIINKSLNNIVEKTLSELIKNYNKHHAEPLYLHDTMVILSSGLKFKLYRVRFLRMYYDKKIPINIFDIMIPIKNDIDVFYDKIDSDILLKCV